MSQTSQTPHPEKIPAPEQLRDGCWVDWTVNGLLAHRAGHDPGGVAAQWDGGALTWAELETRSDRVAAGLARRGLSRGEVLSCQLPNIPEFLVLHHAAAKLGAVLNPIHMAYRRAEVAQAVEFAGSRLLVVGPAVSGFSHAAMGLEIQRQVPSLRCVVQVGPGELPGCVPWDELLQAPAARAGRAASPDDPFLMLFTSGTTASPKATLHTHNMRVSNSWFCGRDMRLDSSDRMLCCSAFSHMWGILNYWSGLIYGCGQVLLERYRTAAFVEAASRGSATVIIGAPAHAIDLLASAEFDAARLASIRLFALSGAICPPVLVRRLRAALQACTPVIFWGMTETGGGCYTRLDDPVEVIENTTGRASGPCRLAVLDDAGREVAPGCEGELVIGSPFGIREYWRNPEATAASFLAGGWFRTGDIARRDPEGNVCVLGRRKEEINRGGIKFLPDSVERAVLRHPGVRMAVMVGVPDERLGERSLCCVVPAAGQKPPTLEELCALASGEGIARFKWPEMLEIVEELPVTPTGKIQRGVLRQRFARRSCGGPEHREEPAKTAGRDGKTEEKPWEK